EPVQDDAAPPRGHVPEPHLTADLPPLLIEDIAEDTAARSQRLSVRRKSYASDPAAVPLQGGPALPAGDVPELHGLVPTGGGQALAVGAKRQSLDGPGVPLEPGVFPFRRHVP